MMDNFLRKLDIRLIRLLFYISTNRELHEVSFINSNRLGKNI